MFWNLNNKFVILIYINRVGYWKITLLQSSFLINLNLFTKTPKLQLLAAYSVVWSVFPGIVLNQRIYFAVLMSKSSFTFLGAIIKSQKWSKSEALGSNYKFKDGTIEYHLVCPNKYILNSFKFLANNFDIYIYYLDTMYINDYFLM